MKSIKLNPLITPAQKEIIIPGSKSYTNRALIIASLTKNPVKIVNPLISDDTTALITCLRKLGVEIKQDTDFITVEGSIVDIKEALYNLNAKLSATCIRFLLPILSFSPGTKIIKGEEGLNKRPIKELVDALTKLGAKIEYIDKNGFPPLKIKSSNPIPKSIVLNGGTSSQYLSAILMSMPFIKKFTIKIDGSQISKPYVDTTIDIMKNFGVDVINNNYQEYKMPDNQEYKISKYIIEGDYSSAGYFFAIAALTHSNFLIQNLNPKSLQADKKLIDILEDMGNIINYGKNSISISGNGVKAVNVDMRDFPDQAQTLAVMAAFAHGKTVLSGLQSLHIKETDRLKAIEIGLKRMNIRTESTYDTLTIFGASPTGAKIDTFEDHRTAMSFAIAGSLISGMEISNPEVVTKTFPTFWKILNKIGIKTINSN